MYSYFFCRFEIDEIIKYCKPLKLLHSTDNLYDVFASLMGFLTVDLLEQEKITLCYFAQKLFKSIKSFTHIHKAANDLHKHNKFVCKAILEF